MKVVILLLLLALATPVEADRCPMTGGCIGQVGLMYVPHSQRQGATVFVNPGLPVVNAVATLKENGNVFRSDSVLDKRFADDLTRAVKENRRLEWGSELDGGATVRILGYQTFPQFGQYSGELFVLVLILTDR